jgi:uncharacterized protein YecE (DUF72 family)
MIVLGTSGWQYRDWRGGTVVQHDEQGPHVRIKVIPEE